MSDVIYIIDASGDNRGPSGPKGDTGSLSAGRETSSFVSTLAVAEQKFVTLPANKCFQALKIEADHPCWLRLYVSQSARAQDFSRTIETDPVPGYGLLAEFIFTVDLLSIEISPMFIGANLETVPLPEIYCTIKNLDVLQRDITVNFTYVPLETA